MAQRKKPAPASTDGVLWRTKFRGTPIRLTFADLTVQRLRQMKQWFGESYGIPTEFMRLLFLNEVDAVTCGVWIGLQKARKPVDDPRDLDFNLSDDFETLEDVQPPEGEAKKNPPTAAEATASPSTGSDDGA